MKLKLDCLSGTILQFLWYCTPCNPIIVVHLFNFAVADDADGTGHACNRLNTKEEGESSTTGTNYNTDGIICYTVKTRVQEHPVLGFRLVGFLYIGYFR